MAKRALCEARHGADLKDFDVCGLACSYRHGRIAMHRPELYDAADITLNHADVFAGWKTSNTMDSEWKGGMQQTSLANQGTHCYTPLPQSSRGPTNR